MSSSYASERPGALGPAPPMTWWIGMSAFAGIILLIASSMHVIAGLMALFREDYFLLEPGRLALVMSYTGWGWVHLLFGLLLAAAAIGIFLGQIWARVIGVIFAVISALTNLTFLAALPLWCAILIAMDVLVIYALTVHGRDVRPRRDHAEGSPE